MPLDSPGHAEPKTSDANVSNEGENCEGGLRSYGVGGLAGSLLAIVDPRDIGAESAASDGSLSWVICRVGGDSVNGGGGGAIGPSSSSPSVMPSAASRRLACGESCDGRMSLGVKPVDAVPVLDEPADVLAASERRGVEGAVEPPRPRRDGLSGSGFSSTGSGGGSGNGSATGPRRASATGLGMGGPASNSGGGGS